MTDECKHVKVYADYILTSYPPISPWICAACGQKGQDRGSLLTGITYKELEEKFNDRRTEDIFT